MILAIILHLVICMVLSMLKYRNYLVMPLECLILAWFLPVFGVLMVLLAHRHSLQLINNALNEGVDVSKSKEEQRMIEMVLEDRLASIVPLEEAMAINDFHTRRELLWYVMLQDKKSYIPVLKKASRNDDGEVVHYAATAVMEVQREFEMSVLHHEQLTLQFPSNPDYVDGLLAALKEYIDSGLMGESITRVWRLRYAKTFEERRSMGQLADSLCLLGVDNYLELRMFDEAITLLNDVKQESEEKIIVAIKLHYLRKDFEQLKEVVQSITLNPYQLTENGRETIQFWRSVL